MAFNKFNVLHNVTRARKTMNKNLLPVQICLLMASVACWQFFFNLHENADTYFAINLGRYILENGFPHIDPFTIHENLKLVTQQWLSGIFFFEVYKNFGVNGLRLADFICGVAMILIYWRLCLLVSGGNKALSFSLSFAVSLLIMNWIVPRPHIFSTLFLLIEVSLLERFTRTKNFKFLLPLPLVSLLLINFHAAMWLMSLVVCLPFLFVKDSRHIKFLLAAMVGIFLFGLINPYGVEAMTYVFNSYGVEIISENVPEMFSPTAHTVSGKFFFLTEALLIFSLTKFKVPCRYIFLSGGITFLAIMNIRSLILFYFLATFPLAFAWKDFSIKNFSGRTLMTVLFLLLLIINTAMITLTLRYELEKLSTPLEILFFIATLFAVYNLLIVKVEGRILHPSILPQKNLSLLATAFIVTGIYFTTLNKDNPSEETYTAAIKFLLRTEQPENISLYIEQSGGGTAGYLGVRYYIDSRSEVFIPANNGQKNILEEYIGLRDGKIYYKDFFSRYNFSHIILTNETPFIFNQLSDDKTFKVIYESERVEGYKVIRCKIFIPPKVSD